YIQYAHARISSIFKKYREKTGVDAETEIEPDKEKLKLLSGEDDLTLIKQLGKFPHLIESIIETLEGHRLNDYLYEVASTLQVYYTRHRVIGDDDELTRARLLLMKAVRSVIANGLSLLGITAPYSM
ncbi:MAG: arginine--tRNA ligase, partial [Thermoplasmata archaeon]|nr:arginine--tRNA ligase [Thermoplasmata archaeon]